MYYEINVSKNGYHLFATAERSITTQTELKRVLDIFKTKFPKEEGYEMSVTKWEKIGHFIDMD